VTGAHLVQILLPLADNDGRSFGPDPYAQVRAELTDRFGGLTAYTRAPAQGVWRDEADRTSRDDVVVFEVVVEDELDAAWWGDYRRALETRFRQERILVRVQAIRLL
jgi:hypothetical protein